MYPSSLLQPGSVHSSGGVSQGRRRLNGAMHTMRAFYLPQTLHEQLRRWLQRPLSSKPEFSVTFSNGTLGKGRSSTAATWRGKAQHETSHGFIKCFRQNTLPSIWTRPPSKSGLPTRRMLRLLLCFSLVCGDTLRSMIDITIRRPGGKPH